MKIIAPDYYPEFHCIAGACAHTCCAGWEIDIDEKSLPRFLASPDIARHVVLDGENAQIRLMPGERCPFLNEDGLCDMILCHGEDFLCDICRDHPRFRNFRSDRVELGLGLVCETAAELILFRDTPMRLIELSSEQTKDYADEEPLPPTEEEKALFCLRDSMLAELREVSGPAARLREYLIYRHLADALYDGRIAERIAFIGDACREITCAWTETDGSRQAMISCAARFSYDVEYDEEEKERRIASFGARKE